MGVAGNALWAVMGAWVLNLLTLLSAWISDSQPLLWMAAILGCVLVPPVLMVILLRGVRRESAHYVLLWRESVADRNAATSYIREFRCASGTSLEEAVRHQSITIVGSAAGITLEQEDELRQRGCQVERLDGKLEEHTAALLQRRVDEGVPFKNRTEQLGYE